MKKKYEIGKFIKFICNFVFIKIIFLIILFFKKTVKKNNQTVKGAVFANKENLIKFCIMYFFSFDINSSKKLFS